MPAETVVIREREAYEHVLQETIRNAEDGFQLPENLTDAQRKQVISDYKRTLHQRMADVDRLFPPHVRRAQVPKEIFNP